MLEIGNKAPAFSLVDETETTRTFDDYKGQWLVIYFYPKDNTPGCNAEACNLRDNYDDLLGRGFKIIGVSADPAASHLKFREKFSLPFPLIPDVEKRVISDYGIWGMKKFMGKEYMGIHRTTFVISEEGKIEKIFTKVKTKDHTRQILDEFGV